MPDKAESRGHGDPGALAGEELAAGVCDEDVVFDADAELAGEVDAGLDGDDLAGLEYALGLLPQERQLMDFQAEAVAGPAAPASRAASAEVGHE